MDLGDPSGSGRVLFLSRSHCYRIVLALCPVEAMQTACGFVGAVPGAGVDGGVVDVFLLTFRPVRAGCNNALPGAGRRPECGGSHPQTADPANIPGRNARAAAAVDSRGIGLVPWAGGYSMGRDECGAGADLRLWLCVA